MKKSIATDTTLEIFVGVWVGFICSMSISSVTEILQLAYCKLMLG